MHFFSPVTKARARLASSDSLSVRYKLITATPGIVLASAGSYLMLNPSEKYAKHNPFNQIAFPASCVLTSFLINLYAIHYLNKKFDFNKGIQPTLMLAFLLGTLSALPAFFTQLIESNEPGAIESIFVATAVTLGSIPLQAVGVVEYIENAWPRILRLFYKHSLVQNSVDAFIMRLEQGFNNLVIQNNIPNDFLSSDERDLLVQLLQNTDYSRSENSSHPTVNRIIKNFSGILSAFLSECINMSFMKATYDILVVNMNSGLSGCLTSVIVFPMMVLSAEFGFKVGCHFIEIANEALGQLIGSERNMQVWFRAYFSIHHASALMTLLATLCITSLSFTSLIQFNNDVFKHTLSAQNLMLLNCTTIVGCLIFNNYITHQILNDWRFEYLHHFGSESVKKQVQFHKFSKIVLNEYQRMPKEFLVTAIPRLEESANVNPLTQEIDGNERSDTHRHQAMMI